MLPDDYIPEIQVSENKDKKEFTLQVNTPLRWETKSVDDILNDINNFVEQLHEEKPYDPNMPPWSYIPIEDEKERKWLEESRKLLSKYLGAYVGPIYFIGYKPPESVGSIQRCQKIEQWFLEWPCKLIEIQIDEPEFIKLENNEDKK